MAYWWSSIGKCLLEACKAGLFKCKIILKIQYRFSSYGNVKWALGKGTNLERRDDSNGKVVSTGHSVVVKRAQNSLYWFIKHLKQFSSFTGLLSRCQTNLIWLLARKIPNKATPKDREFEKKNKLWQKHRKIIWKIIFLIPAGKSWLMQPFHGSCSCTLKSSKLLAPATES